MANLQTLESQLISWEEWDNGEVVATYRGCSLLQSIGYFEKGRRFRKIIIDYDQSVIVITDNDSIDHVFQLILSTGKPLIGSSYDRSTHYTKRPGTGSSCSDPADNFAGE